MQLLSSTYHLLLAVMTFVGMKSRVDLQLEDFHKGFSKDVTACPGYTLSNVEHTNLGLTAVLTLAGEGCNAYGKDIKDLIIQVEYQSETRLNVHISDAEKKQYRLPEEVYPWPAPSHYHGHHELEFHYDAKPFAFWITRSSGEIIFDTRSKNIPVYKDDIVRDGKVIKDTSLPAYPLVFEDQYLQIATALPTDAHIYGLGEVIATSGIQRDPNGTIATLWNRDSAGVPVDSNLYGSHPFYLQTTYTKDGSPSHGVFLLNPHGMDVIIRPGVLEYRVLGGTLDLYFFAGPNSKSVIQQYSEVSGKPTKFPFWAFGFHLCRWNGEWVDLKRMRRVVENMKEAGVPLETMWSDLDYMDRYRDFESNERFNPKDYRAFTDWLHSNNQHYVPIVDAAIGIPKLGGKDPYPAYDDGHRLDVFIKDYKGDEFVGDVWPGPTVFPDWTANNTFKWWQANLKAFKELSGYDGIWLDMNEPASSHDGKQVEGLEITDEKGNKVPNLLGYPPYQLHNGWETLGSHSVAMSAKLADGSHHYNIHNLFGYMENIATRHSLIWQSTTYKRPFTLSRSTFAGQGQMGAHWLGDNYSTWKSMYESIQGILQFSMYQMPMTGADVCGFAGNATEELCNRWMQLGAFYPFFRNHNADSNAGQEPYKWKSVAEASRKAIGLRYRLLPYWESLFAQAHKAGTPVIRPLFMEFDDPKLANVDRQFLVGGDLLITPVLEEGATSVRGHFPGQSGWRDIISHKVVETDKDGTAVINAPLGHIPVHIRPGSVIIVYNEPKYTLTETRKGTLGLIVNLDQGGEAGGEFVIDDGVLLDSPETNVKVVVKDRSLHITATGDYPVENMLTSVTIMGVTDKSDVKSEWATNELDISLLPNGDPVSIRW